MRIIKYLWILKGLFLGERIFSSRTGVHRGCKVSHSTRWPRQGCSFSLSGLWLSRPSPRATLTPAQSPRGCPYQISCQRCRWGTGWLKHWRVFCRRTPGLGSCPKPAKLSWPSAAKSLEATSFFNPGVLRAMCRTEVFRIRDTISLNTGGSN